MVTPSLKYMQLFHFDGYALECFVVACYRCNETFIEELEIFDILQNFTKHPLKAWK
jgi:hypothetical protein